ncbi:DNA primase [Spiroplasma culicicola]|uniref:DNA primase n=1 Tax=Spiroplasma culicicola AES-1 TaxID=1276246 RepID=W6AHA2_9MOLU|nr:DNA primase [Spiroplasma culicicola]AHI53069.1 DNA primase [Spiroplasma culicicola AES-1]
MAINQSQIDGLLNKVSIVDVIGKYIDIQKKGRNYLSVCPFHDDSDPSMHISPDKRIFKCFVCGTGGNVITFVQEFNNVTFFKAVSLIAKEYKIKIDGLKEFDDKPKFTSEEAKLFNINKEAVNFFTGMMISNYAKRARSYLNTRKIVKNELSKFDIGYCPSEVSLYDYLIKMGYDKKIIAASGLIYSKGVSNKCFFEKRIIFPICDEENNVIGFSGRAFLEGDEPKYKNSIENLIFKKSQLAYNFYNAKKDIRIKNEVLILEGFMDVISLQRININNAIAIMGTSFTDFHVKLLSKVTKNFKLFLDGDKAGVNAALKTAMFLMDKKINVTIIYNQTNKDPDELVVAGEKNLITQMIENALHPIDFAIEFFKKDLNLNDSLNIQEFVNKIVDLINHEQSQIMRDISINKLSQITNIDRETIMTMVKNKGISLNQPVEAHQPMDDFVEQMYIPNDADYVDDGFHMDGYYEPVENHVSTPENKPTVNNDLKTQNIFNAINKSKFSKNLSEASIILELLKSDEYLELIENNINKFFNKNIRIIAKFIIEKYKQNSYSGNDFELIASELAKIDKKLYELIFQLNNILFLAKAENKAAERIEDMFRTIEIYSLWTEVEEYQLKMKETIDHQLKMTYLIRIEELMKSIKKLEDKWRN